MVHAVGSEFLVNDKTQFGQHESAIVALPDGSFSIGWVDPLSATVDGGEQGLPVSDEIRGRVFGATGQPVSASSVLSGIPYNPSDTYLSALAGTRLEDGDVAFGWRATYTDSAEEDTRTYSPALVPTSAVNMPEFRVSSAPRQGLDLSPTTGGSYLLGYLRDGTASIEAIIGDARTVADTRTEDSNSLSLVGLADHSAAILYFGRDIPDSDDAATGLNFQRLDSRGNPAGASHQIPVDPGTIDTISTALLADGDIAVVLGRQSVLEATALVIDPAGDIVISPFTAGDHGGQVAALSGGGFVITWTDPDPVTGDGAGSAIEAQAFSGAGAALGAAMLVNTSTAKDQFDPVAAGLADGNFVVSWTDGSGKGGDASSTSIKARVFTLDGIDRPHGTIESTSGNDTLLGTPGSDVFFFDTAAGRPLGRDVIQGFAAGDRIVTTSAISYGNNHGTIALDSSDRLTLPGASGDPSVTSTGTVKIFNENDKALSHLIFLGVEAHDGAKYFVYEGAGDSSAHAGLLFG